VQPPGSDSPLSSTRAASIPPEIPPLRIEEAQRILSALEDVLSAGEAILIGGQAVALWVSYFEPLLVDLDGGRVDVARPHLDVVGRCTVASRGGIRTRDLRVMRSPKGGRVGSDCPWLLGLGRAPSGWICSKRNLEWNLGDRTRRGYERLQPPRDALLKIHGICYIYSRCE
jgi:hypothetical protein